MEQNLNLYQIFYEVARHLSISAAAKKLYISQPAVSKSIARLEAGLQTKLFHRSSRGVSLTKEGKILYRQVEHALESIRSGEEFIRQAAVQDITELSIGVSTTLCKHILLPYLNLFILTNPKVKLSISCQSTNETINAIKRGDISLGLVGISAHQEDITYLPLKEIQDTFVATETYLKHFPFSGERLDDMLGQASFILLDKENISRKHVEDYLRSHSITLKNMIEVNNMDLSIEFARFDLGIACVIKDFVLSDLKKGTLQEINFRYKIPKRQIGFVYAKNQALTHPMNQFIQHYRHQLPVK